MFSLKNRRLKRNKGKRPYIHPDILQLTKNLVAMTSLPVVAAPPPPPKPKLKKKRAKRPVIVQPPPPPPVKQPVIEYDDLPAVVVDSTAYQSLIDKRKARVAEAGGTVKVVKKGTFLR